MARFLKSLVFGLMLGGMLVVPAITGDGVCAEKPGSAPSGSNPAVAKEESLSAKPTAPKANVDVVYYFMTTQRCPSCKKIEAYTKEAVERSFAGDLKNGAMVYRMVNVDWRENNHFKKDYQVYTKSVVVVKIRDGKQTMWKNLVRVWELLFDKEAFQDYIVKEVKAFKEKG